MEVVVAGAGTAVVDDPGRDDRVVVGQVVLRQHPASVDRAAAQAHPAEAGWRLDRGQPMAGVAPAVIGDLGALANRAQVVRLLHSFSIRWAGAPGPMSVTCSAQQGE